jgi:hypothetical protein
MRMSQEDRDRIAELIEKLQRQQADIEELIQQAKLAIRPTRANESMPGGRAAERRKSVRRKPKT